MLTHTKSSVWWIITPCASIGWISSLHNEVRYYPEEQEGIFYDPCIHQQEKPEKLGAVVVALHAELYKVPASFGAFCRPELYIDLPHSCLESHLSRYQH